MNNTKQTLTIGSRVRTNDNFAMYARGLTGTIVDVRFSTVDQCQVFVIKFDTPKSPAAGWPTLETCGASADSYELLANE